MVLVFCFLGIVVLIVLLSVILILSTIKISLEKIEFKIDSLELKEIEFNDKFLIKLELYLFNKIKIAKIKIDKKKIEKLNIKEKIKNLDYKKLKADFNIDKDAIKLVNKMDIQIDKFKLDIDIGVESVTLTPFLVLIISTFISIILSKYATNRKSRNYKYAVNPIYNKNMLKVNFNCIINIKIGHIIHMIYLLRKRRVDIYGRTSNRRAYDYSYE